MNEKTDPNIEIAYRTGPFKFNLLPPKSRKQVELEVERDDSLLYAMVLVFVTGLVFFGITLGQSLLVNPRLNEFEASKKSREDAIATFEDEVAKNGELFVKTRTLAPVLEKKINSSRLFEVADIIESFGSNINVIGYGRERSGQFSFEVSTTTLSAVSDLIDQVNEIEGLSRVFIRGSKFREVRNDVITTIVFDLDEA